MDFDSLNEIPHSEAVRKAASKAEGSRLLPKHQARSLPLQKSVPARTE